MYKFTDPVKGETYQPLTIVPALMAYCDPSLLVFTKGREQELSVMIQQKAMKYPEEEKSAMHSTSAISENNGIQAPSIYFHNACFGH